MVGVFPSLGTPLITLHTFSDATAVSFHRKDVKDRAVETMTWYADAQNGRYHLQDEENAIDLSKIEVVAGNFRISFKSFVPPIRGTNLLGEKCSPLPGPLPTYTKIYFEHFQTRQFS